MWSGYIYGFSWKRTGVFQLNPCTWPWKLVKLTFLIRIFGLQKNPLRIEVFFWLAFKICILKDNLIKMVWWGFGFQDLLVDMDKLCIWVLNFKKKIDKILDSFRNLHCVVCWNIMYYLALSISLDFWLGWLAHQLNMIFEPTDLKFKTMFTQY